MDFDDLVGNLVACLEERGHTYEIETREAFQQALDKYISEAIDKKLNSKQEPK